MVADLAGVPAPFGLVAGIAGGIGSVVAGVTNNLTPGRLCWRAGCWLTAGSWATWALATSPWSPAPAGGLVAATIATATTARIRSRRRAKRAAAAALSAIEQARLALALEWEDRIKRVCDVQVTVRSIAAWPSGAGFTLQADLPSGGVTIRQIAAAVDGLASDARLPQGCEITVRPGAHRGSVEIAVATYNALDRLHRLDEYGPLSIANDLPIGVQRNNTKATINLAYACAVLVGQTDSGKTNELQVINTQLVRCVDTVVWHIELAGGGMTRPWVTPYHEGRAAHPVIDWVALTVAEAELMCDAAINIIDGRKRAYAKRMRDANDDKLPVDREVPEVIIVVDELKKVPRHVQARLATISDTGRAARVRLVSCALRATDDYLPIALKEQSQVRIGMRVSDEKELAYLYSWAHRLDPTAAPYSGCGFVVNGDPEAGATPIPFKGYRMDPSSIDVAAMTVAAWRPDLDRLSVEMANGANRAGDAYDGRWTRMMPRLFADSPEEPMATTPPDDANQPRRDVDDIEHLFDPIPGDTPAKALERLQDKVNKLKEANAQREPGAPDLEAQFNAIVGNMAVAEPQRPQSPAESAAAPRTGRDLVADIIDAAGPAGIGTGDILTAYAARGGTEHPNTVKGWLGDMVDTGQLLRPKQGLYVAPRHQQH